MSKTKIPELLAPAGDWSSLKAAIDAGADAVYFGVRGFNMRAGAKNFAAKDLPRIAALCHAHEVRAYLALNVVVFEREVAALRKLLASAKAAGVDAIIAADFAVLAAAGKAGLAVHASTQMSVANSAAVEFLHGLGVRRFVLARECSLRDIAHIRKALVATLGKRADTVQIEVFAHGAMCVSMSGRCFLSNFEAGRSANRGDCAQHCRREYRIVEEHGGAEWVLGKNYILSPGDLCTLPFLEKLISAGVDSLKIEGRNRGPEYVATVVSVYRQALDFHAAERGNRGFAEAWKAKREELTGALSKVYHRKLSSGFYLGKPVGAWNVSPQNVATEKKFFVGVVTNFYRRAGVAEVTVQNEAFRLGDELLIEGRTTGFFRQKVESLRREEQAIETAGPGLVVGLKVDAVVRRGDKIYVMRPRTSGKR